MTKKVLIIDDELDICLLLKSQLTKNSLEVQYETSLKTGVMTSTYFRPDYLILDNNLPDGLGIEYIADFKKSHPQMKIILITAHGNLNNLALIKGADVFLKKPFKAADIYKYIVT